MSRARYIAVGFAALVLVSGIAAKVTGDGTLLGLLVEREVVELRETRWAVVSAIVLTGLLDGLVLWHALRGRGRAEPRRDARWLRVALLALVAVELLPLPAWVTQLTRLAVVGLTFPVLNRAPAGLPLVALAAGLWATLGRLLELTAVAPGSARAAWLIWVTLTLTSQATEGRWARATIWWGAVGVAGPSVISTYALMAAHDEVSSALAYVLPKALEACHLVWLARTAHESVLSPPAVPPKSAWRWGAAPVAAVLLPVLPAAADLADGAVRRLGPLPWLDHLPGLYLERVWMTVNHLVGVGGAGVLVMVALVRGSRRLMVGAAGVLLVVAAAGLVEAAMTAPQPGAAGISPLWHSVALAGSAVLLLHLSRPVRRRPYQVILLSAATLAALLLVPASDHDPGPTTTARACEPPGDPFGGSPPVRPAEQEFVCRVRMSAVEAPMRDMPDRMLIAYGRRLCGVHTRDDPVELARFRRDHGVDPRDENTLLQPVCPSAAAEIRALKEADEREARVRQAEERRKCDAAPRHRLRIKTVRSTRWTHLDGARPGSLPGGRHDHAHGPAGWRRAAQPGRRPGHYRVRVHHAWIAWKGEKMASQRLLIMAHPGEAEDRVVHPVPR